MLVCVSITFLKGVIIFLIPLILLVLYIVFESPYYVMRIGNMQFLIQANFTKYNRKLIDKARRNINQVPLGVLQVNLSKIYNDIDKRINQEDGLLNQRINFFLLAETFLILPYFQVLSSWPQEHVLQESLNLAPLLTDSVDLTTQKAALLTICFLGALTSILATPSVRLAVQAIEYYQTVWKLIKLRIIRDREMLENKTEDLNLTEWIQLRIKLDEYQETYGPEDEMRIEKIEPTYDPSLPEPLARVSIWFDHKNAMLAGRGIGLLSLLPYIFYLIWIVLAVLAFTFVK